MTILLTLAVISCPRQVASETTTFAVNDYGWPTAFRAAAKADVYVVGAKDIRIWKDRKWSVVPSGVRPGRAAARSVVCNDLSDDGAAAVLNVSGKIKLLRDGVLSEHRGSGVLTQCILSTDGSMYCVFGGLGVKVFNKAGRQVREERIAGIVTTPGISSDSTQLAAFGVGKLHTLGVTSSLKLPDHSNVRVCALNVDAKLLLIEDLAKQLSLYNFDGKRLAQATLATKSLKWHYGVNGGERVQLRRDGKMAAVLCEDQTVALFKVGEDSLKPAGKVSAPTGWKLWGIQFNFENKLAVLMASGRSYKIVTYNVAE